MQRLLIHCLAFALALAFTACASYKTQYSRQAKNWMNDTLSIAGEPDHIMYLVGDAGDDSPEKPAAVIHYLKNKLATESKKSSIVFLGDNIYEYGMPPKEDSLARSVAEYRINAQLEALDDFKGRPVFIPGNHDWRGWGVKGLKREEKYIQEYLNTKRGKKDKDDWEDYFLPKDGCSGAEVVELSGNVVLIVIDTEWWLRDWDKAPGINEDCIIKNRENFSFIFENTLRKYRSKQVVVAMHHPLLSYGSHGGDFPARDFIFPLTEVKPNLYLPMPITGTLAASYRGSIGSRQDLSNQHYRELRQAIMAAARKNGNFIFASGHEHALEYIEDAGQSIVVSGSGSKNTAVKLGKGSFFATPASGYATIAFYKNGEILLRYWQVEKDASKATLLFRKKLIKAPLSSAEEQLNSYTVYDEHKDSMVSNLTHDSLHTTGGLHNFLIGEHYRDLYLHSYAFPVLDLAKFKGGVTAVKLGGGNQTNSLRVEDAAGRDYVLRGLNKDVSRFLPFPFNRMTAAKKLVKENFLATLPFAPTAVASIASAINVYHTNPTLYYVPYQPVLQQYNDLFGNSISLVEERPAGKKWKDAAFFGNADKIVSTPDVMEDILENNKHKVDQAWALRTRLLDFLVGDWDRHDDQWAWASIKIKDGTDLYRPIPRDRDQAFSKYDGLTTSIARFSMAFLRQLQVYGPVIKSTKWNTWSARLFDRTFLTELSWPQWEDQVHYIQQNLTDSLIEHAFDTWPTEARALVGDNLIASVKQRRNDLMKLAKIHYEFINKEVNVLGTDERERFVIDRMDDEHTRVAVYEVNKDGEIKKNNYERVFENDITKTVNLFGNGSGDEFIVNGEVSKGIKIRMIGGQGKDFFIDSSIVRRGPRKSLVYDDLKNNTVIAGRETRDLRTSLYRYNMYDRRDYSSEYDFLVPQPVIGINPDDGLLLGANLTLVKYGFKKEPYKSRQNFGGSYAFATHSVGLHYAGDFLNALGRLDFYMEGLYHGPSFAFNFAGIGNETKRPVNDPDYYRVRQSEIFLYAAVKKRLGINGFVSLGPFFQYTNIDQTKGRYLADSLSGTKNEIFRSKYYSGARLIFDFNNVDNFFAPHSGVRFNTSFYYAESLTSKADFGAWRASFAFYKAIDQKENLVLASQVGTGINVGTGYSFFQMPSIGGDQGLRGYRTERFYGNKSFWHSTDLRLRFGSSYNEALPFTIGIFGGFDYGRVWEKNVHSNAWHTSYGGGLWFAPVDLLTLSCGVFFPGDKTEESPRFTLKLGFAF